MKTRFRILVLAAILALVVTTAYVAVAYETESVSSPVNDVPAAVPSPATYEPEAVPVHPALLSTYEAFFPPTVIEVTDGVYVARGYNRDNPTLIEGSNGLIVVDPGESILAAQEVKKAFNEHLDNIFDRKPVKAIIYTHEHDCHIHGASVFADDRTVIYAHESMVRSLFDEWYSQIYPSRVEGGIKMSGLLFMDAPVRDGKGWYTGYVLSAANLIGPSGFMPPTRTVKEELKTTIAGVEIHLIPVAAETHDVLLVWLPRKDVLIEIGVLYEAFPALTTMRGSGQRNPLDYLATLKLCRGLNPEYLVALHGAHPVTAGKENVREYLTNFSDAIQFMHDQTVQYMNLGYTPGEIMEMLELPPHLASSNYLQETYGGKDWDIYHIFRYYRGYYTGKIRDLFPQSPMSEAQMSAELAGGIDALAGKAEEAMAEGNLEWALRLADDVLLLDPENQVAFETKKASMLALAANTMNSQARNMLLSDYLVMTDQVHVPVVLGQPKLTFSRMDPNAVRLMPMDTLHRIMAVNLNASKSMATDMVVGLQLTDVRKNDRGQPNRYILEVRKGILEVDPPSASNVEFVIATDSSTWKELGLYKLEPEVAVADGKVTISEGTPASFYDFMDLFE